MAARPNLPALSTISFNVNQKLSQGSYSRTGTFILRRDDDSTVTLNTPGLMAPSSRGVIPHLSQDQLARVPHLGWIHVPFENYLQDKTPLPTICPDAHPLHKLMSLKTEKHIVSMSLRDPSSANEMPANTAEFIQTQCIRGCRKVRPPDYISYVSGANPDIVIAPGDTPFTPPPYSQKRIEKSITRTLTWLTQLSTGLAPRPIFVPLMGGTNINARAAFSRGSIMVTGTTTSTGPLVERLDETLAGYVLEIAPIQAELRAQLGKQNGVVPPPLPTTTPSARAHAFATNVLAAPDPLESDILNYAEDIDTRLPELVRSSLDPLSLQKPRLALGLALASPHVMLGLVEQGVDLIDSALAIRCASAGVALDFVFPVVGEHSGDKLDVGHNLYDSRYEEQFSSLSDKFTDASSNPPSSDKPICYCAACSPIWETQPIEHSKIDELTSREGPDYAPAYTRAYIHHLLHTHEMSAHTLLTFHNLAVLEAMMAGARSTIENGTFEKELRVFEVRYDGGMRVLREAEKAWRGVDRARGKGRLGREKAEKEQYALEE
ncbi:queuine tRNA-ribosyltransferase [Rhizoctonia solani AG-3 Rhs1AP]|uniref:Queuine tRNA-ribosyltransferase n=1 Tax=Rhizoctonia solani AG-3 Rhs1AP TaxID=1086054 RepID=X8JJ00_9AGAM|nr:queuine tRNA-ribosyltransferase [Rhizoctonia solani AG-3 Rhs1AP]